MKVTIDTAVNFTNFIDGQPQQVYVERMGVFEQNGHLNVDEQGMSLFDFIN